MMNMVYFLIKISRKYVIKSQLLTFVNDLLLFIQ